MARHERPPEPRAARFRAAVVNALTAFPVIWAMGLTSLAGLSLAIAVGELVTGVPEATDGLYATAVFAALAVPGALVAWWQHRGEERGAPPERPKVVPPLSLRVERRHPLPRPGSAARQPMRQLGEAEHALAEVLRQLAETVPAEVIERTWHTAQDTVTRLRAVGVRVEVVELAAAHASPVGRAALEDGAGELLAHLQRGLESYQGLVAAAGRVVLASAPDPAADELAEATERLAGLAEGLTEVASRTRLAGAGRETRAELEGER